jgi:alpha-1,3-mannosyl-glycoprotein beta-1,2-N-acetylglucosaminyltransferase
MDPAESQHLPPVPKSAVDPVPAVTALHEARDSSSHVVIPVLVIACDRAGVARTLDSLLKHNPDQSRFPVIVSQDCGHAPTASIIRSYNVQHITQPDLSDIKVDPAKKGVIRKNEVGYYKIARHYKWALSQVFLTMNHSAVIIVEDDLEVSSDFFEYFSSTLRLLEEDKSLFCVSAWNDNGKADNIDSSRPDLLYRTDFFPGLGWMLTRDAALPLLHKWPLGYWDDWVRQPTQMQDRACIRPEVGRTSTFGRMGVSHGQFFEQHLQYIKHSQSHVLFSQMDLSYLLKSNYDSAWDAVVAAASVVSAQDLKTRVVESRVVRVLYSTNKNFELVAKSLGIMSDFKDGVPRTAYRGVVTFMYSGVRVYLSPATQPWTGYRSSR